MVATAIAMLESPLAPLLEKWCQRGGVRPSVFGSRAPTHAFLGGVKRHRESGQQGREDQPS